MILKSDSISSNQRLTRFKGIPINFELQQRTAANSMLYRLIGKDANIKIVLSAEHGGENALQRDKMKVNLKSGQSFVDGAIFRSLSFSCQKVGHSLHRAMYFDYLKQFLNKLSEYRLRNTCQGAILCLQELLCK